MGNPTITAEDFSQLYASLETLEVKQIVSTLLQIPPLREEIRRRVTPRKRRTKAMMVADAIIAGYKRPRAELSSHADIHALSPKRKSRKSTPVKLQQDIIPSSKQAKPTVIKSVDSAFTSTQHSVNVNGIEKENHLSNSPEVVSPTPSTTSNDHAEPPKISEPFFNLSSINSAFPPPLLNPAIAYMNWYRLAANQLVTRNMMVLKPIPTLPKITHPTSLEYDSLLKHDQLSSREIFSPHTPTNQREDNFNENNRDDIGPPAPNLTIDTTGHCSSLVDIKSAVDSGEQTTTEINCPDCGQALALSALHQHLQNDCSKRHNKFEKFSANMLKAATTMNWETCAICSESIPGRDMIKHIRLQHAVARNPFKCDQCDESFRNKSTLKRHKITHTEGGGFSCNICAKVFAKPELLKRHELIHTEMSRSLWPCPHCGKGFSNKYNLAVHERIHTGEMPFQCPECPERFRVKCSMQNHIKSKHLDSYNEDSSELESSRTSPDTTNTSSQP